MEWKRIDWLNHSIAFASSVIGIFIAFQLDDWQERRSREIEIEVAMEAIKAEVEGNLAVYHSNDSTLQVFIDYADFFFKHSTKNGLMCTNREFETMRDKYQYRFTSCKVVRKINDSLTVYNCDFKMDVIPQSGISTGNWEAARSSGILNYLGHDKTVLLTQIYEWTLKDLGYSDDKLYSMLISFGEFDDMEKVVESYRMISKVARIKHSRMKSYYDQIKW